MSQFSGKQGEGAMRTRREKKREEAEARNLLTKPERRRDPAKRLLAEIFTEVEPGTPEHDEAMTVYDGKTDITV